MREADALFAAGGLIFFVVLIALIPTIFYLLTLQNTLLKVSPENRKMPPGQVWLTLIPLFGIVWRFIVVNKIADSLQAEFAKRNIRVKEARPGAEIGIAYCVLSVCGIVPFLGPFCALAALVCWIIYWVRIHEYQQKIAAPYSGPSMDDESTFFADPPAFDGGKKEEDWFKE